MSHCPDCAILLSRALAAEQERDEAVAKVAAFERKPWRQSTGIACDFCGGPIPEGGEGHPEICPSCIKNERKTEALREERDAALAKLAEMERERYGDSRAVEEAM